MVENGLSRLGDYEPTDVDRVLCAAMDRWFLPLQRAAVRQHADEIEPVPGNNDDVEAAVAWIEAQATAGNTAPSEEVLQRVLPYVFGATGYSGALGYLVEIISVRRRDRECEAVIVEIWERETGQCDR